MKVDVIDSVKVNDDDKVRIKEMGNIIEIMYSDCYGSKCSIRKLDKDRYLDLETGEVKEFKKMISRACDISSTRKTMGRLRDLINTNVIDVNNCKWLTLSYAHKRVEHLTVEELNVKLKNDFKNFNKRLRDEVGHYEYINVVEPCGNGIWHCHVLLIFNSKAPYVPNDVIWWAWCPKGFKAMLKDGTGYGFTKTQSLDNVDNVGAYLTAYMCDIVEDDLFNAIKDSPELFRSIADGSLIFKEIEVEEKSVKVTKRVVKGARLFLYPPQFNIYRTSMGIREPIKYYDYEKNIKEKVSAATLTYQKSIQLSDIDNNFTKILDYRYYNLKRK